MTQESNPSESDSVTSNSCSPGGLEEDKRRETTVKRYSAGTIQILAACQTGPQRCWLVCSELPHLLALPSVLSFGSL